MANLANTPDARVLRDPGSDAIRSLFIPKPTAIAAAAGQRPEEIALKALQDSAKAFRWGRAELNNIQHFSTRAGGGIASVRFIQNFKGVAVDDSEIVVNLYPSGSVQSVYNHYHYSIPASLSDTPRITADAARRTAAENIKGIEASSGGEVIIYRFASSQDIRTAGSGRKRPMPNDLTIGTLMTPEEGQYFLAWDFRVSGKQNRTFTLRVLVDAQSGEIISIIDLHQYDTGSGLVFDPNPIVTSGDTTLRHDSSTTTINAQRESVTIQRLDPPIGGNYRLHGSYVQMAELDPPTVAEPLESTGNFSYSFDDNHFLDCMAYFHIDRFQDFIQTVLGITNAANYSIQIDPQGYNGGDNSYYAPGGGGTGYIIYGGGIVPVPSYNPAIRSPTQPTRWWFCMNTVMRSKIIQI